MKRSYANLLWKDAVVRQFPQTLAGTHRRPSSTTSSLVQRQLLETNEFAGAHARKGATEKLPDT
jgi:hypothetical protein